MTMHESHHISGTDTHPHECNRRLVNVVASSLLVLVAMSL